MMCNDVENLMVEYVANELPQEKMDFVRNHIRSCPSCSSWHDDLISISEIWDGLAPPVEELDLVTPVMSTIENKILHQETMSPARKKHLSLWTSLLHYGLAASLTIALFQGGVFDHLSSSLTHMNVLLSVKVQSLYHLAAQI